MSEHRYLYNGLTKSWDRPRLKKCATCGILFETAQRVKKYCSQACHPKNTKRHTDMLQRQLVIWDCAECGEREHAMVLIQEWHAKSDDPYVCNACLNLTEIAV